jgi:hypothetical protein
VRSPLPNNGVCQLAIRSSQFNKKLLVSGWASSKPGRSNRLHLCSLARSCPHSISYALSYIRICHSQFGGLADLVTTRPHRFRDLRLCFERMSS